MISNIEQFAKKISNSLLLTKEAKQAIKDRMHTGKMTKKEIEQIIELLSSEDEVQKRVDVMIEKHFNHP